MAVVIEEITARVVTPEKPEEKTAPAGEQARVDIQKPLAEALDLRCERLARVWAD